MEDNNLTEVEHKKCPHCQENITDAVRIYPTSGKKKQGNGIGTTMELEKGSSATPEVSKPASLPDNLLPLWELPEKELKEAYYSSVVLRRAGMIMYLIPFMFLFLVLSVDAKIFASPILVSGIAIFLLITALLLYPTAYVLRNIRSVKAQKRIINIAIFSELCGIIAFAVIMLLMMMDTSERPIIAPEIRLQDTGRYIATGFFAIIYLLLMFPINRHAKNKNIFSTTPFSHAEIKYVKAARKNPDLENGPYPDKYSENKGSVMMFLCPLIYLFSLFVNYGAVNEIYSQYKQNRKRDAEVFINQGNAAANAKDFTKAKDCFEKAVNLGHPEAKLNLGIIYAEGLAGAPDYEKAFLLLTEDKIITSPLAKYYVGLLYYSGKGTQQDFKQAAQYLKTSAELGYKNAQDLLGYKDGKMPDYGMPLEEVLKRLWEKNNK